MWVTVLTGVYLFLKSASIDGLSSSMHLCQKKFEEKEVFSLFPRVKRDCFKFIQICAWNTNRTDFERQPQKQLFFAAEIINGVSTLQCLRFAIIRRLFFAKKFSAWRQFVNNFDARMSVAKIFGGQKNVLRVFKTSKSQQSSSQGGEKNHSCQLMKIYILPLLLLGN